MFFLRSVIFLGVSNFLYSPQITQYNFFIPLVIENILVLFYCYNIIVSVLVVYLNLLLSFYSNYYNNYNLVDKQ